MPEQKDLKRLIRTRMRKTGESYTTARVQILEQSTRSGVRKRGAGAAGAVEPSPDEPNVAFSTAASPAVSSPASPDRATDANLAELAGMSDQVLRAKTGRSWKEWVSELDAIGAIAMPHREIAQRVHESYGVPGWWTQTVTVGYERIRGLREKGQRRDTGTFEANKSRTLAVPVSRLYRAFAHKATRQRWLPGVELVIRTSIRDKSARVTWPDGTSVHLYFTAKATGRSQLTVQHVGLSNRQDVTARKAYWAERMEALAAML